MSGDAALLAAVGAVAFVIAVAYWANIVSYRTGLDPDTYGIPIVTSSVDFLGALALVTAIVTQPNTTVLARTTPVGVRWDSFGSSGP